jgi:hypothetical protein
LPRQGPLGLIRFGGEQRVTALNGRESPRDEGLGVIWLFLTAPDYLMQKNKDQLHSFILNSKCLVRGSSGERHFVGRG